MPFDKSSGPLATGQRLKSGATEALTPTCCSTPEELGTYPRRASASGTSVTAALVPRWAEADGALLKNLNDSSLRPRLVNEMNQNLARRGGPDSLLMTASHDKTIVGKTLAAVAHERQESPVDAAIEIIKSGGSDVASFNMKESDIEAFMRQSWVMTCSDGSEGHPRKYGTFPRKLRQYVYEKHIIPLEFAIRSSTSLPAETLDRKSVV